MKTLFYLFCLFGSIVGFITAIGAIYDAVVSERKPKTEDSVLKNNSKGHRVK